MKKGDMVFLVGMAEAGFYILLSVVAYVVVEWVW